MRVEDMVLVRKCGAKDTILARDLPKRTLDFEID